MCFAIAMMLTDRISMEDICLLYCSQIIMVVKQNDSLLFNSGKKCIDLTKTD